VCVQGKYITVDVVVVVVAVSESRISRAAFLLWSIRGNCFWLVAYCPLKNLVSHWHKQAYTPQREHDNKALREAGSSQGGAALVSGDYRCRRRATLFIVFFLKDTNRQTVDTPRSFTTRIWRQKKKDRKI
jgi:hypothetical protein